MTCDEAIQSSPSSSCGADTAQGRVLVAAHSGRYYVTFIPRVPEGALNGAGAVADPDQFIDLREAEAVAEGDYAAPAKAWLPVEDLPKDGCVAEAPDVEGHHVGPKRGWTPGSQ